MKTSLFYQPPRDINAKGLLGALPLGILVTLFLGFVYNLLISFIPFIYINFIVTMGFGIAVGWMCKLLYRWFVIRDERSRLGMAIILGLTANVFAWIAFIVWLGSGEGLGIDFKQYLQGIPIYLNPGNTFPIIAEINKYGTWSIFGIDFQGVMLAFVWIIEFGIILAIPVLMALASDYHPYSETQGKWYPKFTLRDHFNAVYNGNRMVEAMQKDVLGALQNEEGGGPARFSKIHIYYLPDEKNQYLSIESFVIEQQGRGATKSNMVVSSYTIPSATAKQILDKYEHKREKLDVV
ncbi:MAG: hypothetical protein GYB31_03755 [Bacteroidetes bacterium]|nr:hypothetical protein [Bacteroidota bacterium]